MTIVQKAFNEGIWLAIFKFITQIIAWSSTIIIARVLLPNDYGLMEMATVLTGYALLFSELGLGAAIIQKYQSSEEELSSVFWFTVLVSSMLGLSCFALAHPTAAIFQEPKVIPLTRTVSILFILNGLAIVPLNLLKKQLEFKKIGFAEMVAFLISIIGMVVIAYAGGGVWALLGGHIIRSFVKLILIFHFQDWTPCVYFEYSALKRYLNFGLIVAISRTFNYLLTKSDRFFAGMVWSATTLGYYSFALFLAQIPTEKIVALITQVSYSTFAQLKDDGPQFNSFYLNINKTTATITLPLFVGGYLAGNELITVLLGVKWNDSVYLFRMLCLSQIFVAITSINSHVFNAKGWPKWNLYYNVICSVVMAILFYCFAQPGAVNLILLPWLTAMPVLSVGFIVITLKKLKISNMVFFKVLLKPILAVVTMIFSIYILDKFLLSYGTFLKWQVLFLKLFVGSISYLGFLLLFDFSFFKKIMDLYRQKTKNLV